MRPTVADEAAQAVCLAVCLSGCLSVSFSVSRDYELCKNGWTDREWQGAFWRSESDSCKRKEPCIRRGEHWRRLTNKLTIQQFVRGDDAA